MRLMFATFVLFATVGNAQTHYDVVSGNGNGFRLWNGNDNFKIHMGNSAEYKYGPVTDYSIKMNMSNTVGRGWTWGVLGANPVAAMSTDGDFQLEKNLMVMNRIGVGTTNPTYLIDAISHTGQTEGFVQMRISDAPGDYFRIFNATGAPGQFIPAIKGIHVSDNRAVLFLEGETDDTNDNGSDALVIFGARRANGPIQSRPLFSWRNYTTQVMTMTANGNLGIGTTIPDSKLSVKGNIHAEEVKVDLSVPGPDYVFKESYDLMSLEEVQEHIHEKGHLPNIPSAQEMEENGIELGIMNMKLLEKIEELTLYMIELKKENAKQQQEIEFLIGRDQR
ncbi:hypothetical protein [Ulvibacterium sp.]|uniref:hypothetical protein n=1 Tax=Ulvibacterium sp. TaxID=2665914 RepID=UPI003BAA0498